MTTFTPHTALITGAGSGIGAALAVALHGRGARVIVTGPTPEKLAVLAARHSGMISEVLDVADADSVTSFAAAISARFPELDCVINSAGIQRLVDFATDVGDVTALAREVDINLTGTVNVVAAFLPHLRTQPKASLILLGSGLGYVPLVHAPIYSATKAAVHSLAISLRRQLALQPVDVIEIIPPAVQTALHRTQAKAPPRAMPIDDFTAAALAGLDTGQQEIAIGVARALRTGGRIAPRLFLGIVNRNRSADS